MIYKNLINYLFQDLEYVQTLIQGSLLKKKNYLEFLKNAIILLLIIKE